MLRPQELGRFLSHPRREVRDQALRCLASGGSRSEVAAELAIVSINRLGDPAFSHPRQVGHLLATEAAIELALKNAKSPASEALLLELSPETLGRHAADIARLPAGALRQRLQGRLALSQQAPQQLWQELEGCSGEREVDVVHALAAHDAFVAPRITEVLTLQARTPMELKAVELAGRIRWAGALERLVDRLGCEAREVAEAAGVALGRIGTAGAIVMIENRCNSSAATAAFRGNAAKCLGRFRIPSVEPALMRLLGEEDDRGVISELCRALTDVCTTMGLPKLLEMAKGGRLEQQVREAVSILDEMVKSAAEKTPAAEAPSPGVSPGAAQFSGVMLGNEEQVISEATSPPAATAKTIKREGNKVGRNDPCPCGSGKKYKKCCGAK